MYAYRQAGLLQRLARRTAATRPMAWVYGHVQERTDQLVYRLTRGKATLSSLLSGLPVIMLTTIGARTGEPRTKPVLGIPEGEHLVVVASNFGRRHNPAWYYNLRAHPSPRFRHRARPGGLSSQRLLYSFSQHASWQLRTRELRKMHAPGTSR